ncbi:MAG: hypothetical protein HYZ42_13720 [Bacteroidetes bacterium]|nr:hypothetical protein [Bacteroidota bacterium]
MKYIVFFTLIILLGCKNDVMDMSDYVKFMEDPSNDFRQEAQIGDYYFRSQYKSIDYVVALEKLQHVIDTKDINKRKGELEGLLYFTYRIDTKKTSSPMLSNGVVGDAGYSNRLSYFFNASSHFYLLDSQNDTLPCKLYHFEQSYSLAPYNDIILGFLPPKQPSTLTIVYDDTELGVGIVKFNYPKELFSDLPKVNFLN